MLFRMFPFERTRKIGLATPTANVSAPWPTRDSQPPDCSVYLCRTNSRSLISLLSSRDYPCIPSSSSAILVQRSETNKTIQSISLPIQTLHFHNYFNLNCHRTLFLIFLLIFFSDFSSDLERGSFVGIG